MKDARTYLIYIAVMPEDNDFPLPEPAHIKTKIAMSTTDRIEPRADSIAMEAKRMTIALDRAIEARRSGACSGTARHSCCAALLLEDDAINEEGDTE
jgi:hypothetical protein